MRVGGIGGTSPQTGNYAMGQALDAYSKNIQKQIAQIQKQMQELSSNEELSMEEKLKKRQELQQKMTDLNNQLRQHQMEQRKEMQQAKQTSIEDAAGKRQDANREAWNGKQGAGLSKASMKSMVSAGAALKQSEAQGSVASRLEGRAGVLESEIKLDSNRGQNVEAKQEELAKVKRQASSAEAAQMNTLGEANKELKETEKKEALAKKADERMDSEDSKGKEEKKDPAFAPNESEILQEGYVSVDVRL